MGEAVPERGRGVSKAPSAWRRGKPGLVEGAGRRKQRWWRDDGSASSSALGARAPLPSRGGRSGSGPAMAGLPRLLLLVFLAAGPLWAAAEPEAGNEREPPPQQEQQKPPPPQQEPQQAAAQGLEVARAEKVPTPVAPVHPVSEDSTEKTNLGFIHAFVAAISVIIVSELGDKTFFIAAIMAMRYNRLTVLAGAMLALGLMTCLSVLFGYATTVIPRVYTYYVSTALFAIFGIRMLREGLKMSADEGQEELEEVQAELKKKDEELQRTKLLNGPGDVETGTGPAMPQRKWLHFISPIFVQAFTLTFLAEWGDRSQLTTIVLAAREDPYGVAVGGTVGHSLCTGLAVIGGRMIAQKISVRTVTIIGGIVFLAFAFSALFISPDAGF
uniref:GDT1 family protein n=1 Tax=Anolis carolinensis TaxID=28377 RepID=G1KJ29_ANOCA|nr:PREDICTED: transmembrane protein 165 [Anolis carolinensis]|eukprot:XP_003221623.2 PREDICTED: transmembrane protein 165 [Anolis carolinensis]